MPYALETIQAIAARHGLSGEPRLLPKGGMVNHAWAIGNAYVLRICAAADAHDEAKREAAVVPLLIEAGMDVPKLVAADSEGSFLGAPYTIYETAQGELLGYCDFEASALSETYRQIGRDLAALHRIEPPDAVREVLRDAEPFRHEKALAYALEKEVLARSEAEAIVAWFEWAKPRMGEAKRPCLLHMDIHPWNVFVDPEEDRLTAIIDWGDTSWGDPACDFSSMPLPAVRPMLEGYVEAGGEVDEGFVLRGVYHGLALGIWELGKLPIEDFDRRWWRMPAGGWEEMRAWIEDLETHPVSAPKPSSRTD